MTQTHTHDIQGVGSKHQLDASGQNLKCVSVCVCVCARAVVWRKRARVRRVGGVREMVFWVWGLGFRSVCEANTPKKGKPLDLSLLK